MCTQMPGEPAYQVQYTGVPGNQMGQPQVVYLGTSNTPQGAMMYAIPPEAMAQAPGSNTGWSNRRFLYS